MGRRSLDITTVSDILAVRRAAMAFRGFAKPTPNDRKWQIFCCSSALLLLFRSSLGQMLQYATVTDAEKSKNF